MDEFVVPLESVRQSDAGRIGGKAAALGTLLAAGFPVPTGICLTIGAFHRALADYQKAISTILRPSALNHPAAAQAAAANISHILAGLIVPPSVQAALRLILPQIAAETTPLAVRSSAIGEDGAEISFAGQYTSHLGVVGEEAIHAAIISCWRSFFSANALAERAIHASLNQTEAMAILIQPLIEAECAGVCFSIDPVQRRRDRLMINAAWGVGAGVVDGSVAADTVWLLRDNFSLEQSQIVEKPEQIVFDTEHGLRRAPVPADRRRAACLPEAWLERIAQFGVAAELLYGSPQDLEWAISSDQLWILQSRPITGLPPELAQTPRFPVTWENIEEARSFWRKENEMVPEIMLPLEQDHLVWLESTWEEACRLLGVERKVQFKYFHGRAYYRRVPITWTEADRRVRHTAMEDLKDRLQQEGRTTWDHWGPEIVKATERLRAFDDTTASGPALAEHLWEALAVGCRHFMLHPLFSFAPRPSFFKAFTALTGMSDSEAKEAAYHLLEESETPLSQLIDSLYDLACTARQHADVATLIADPPADVFGRLKALPQADPFLKQLNTFLASYGERTGNGYGSETSLRVSTWQEAPEKILPIIASYFNPNIEPPATIRKRRQQQLQAQVDALCAACNDQTIVAEFHRQLAYARQCRTVLETHNHYIDQMAMGQLRHAVMAAGRWLAAREALTSPEDVLWLRFDEIFNGLEADTPPSFAGTIAARQAGHAEWSKLEAPPILGVPNAHLPQRPPLEDNVTPAAPDEAGRLVGQGASAGRRYGRARLAPDPLLLPSLEPGDILVTTNVGPLWIPIFPILGGLILEGGAVGQHAAATAREYNIPAVVNVKQATRRIPDGAWLTVDGTTGTIEL